MLMNGTTRRHRARVIASAGPIQRPDRLLIEHVERAAHALVALEPWLSAGPPTDAWEDEAYSRRLVTTTVARQVVGFPASSLPV